MNVDKTISESFENIKKQIKEMITDVLSKMTFKDDEEYDITFRLVEENFWKRYEVYTEVDEPNKKVYFKVRLKVLTRSEVREAVGEEKLEEIEKAILGEGEDEH